MLRGLCTLAMSLPLVKAPSTPWRINLTCHSERSGPRPAKSKNLLCASLLTWRPIQAGCWLEWVIAIAVFSATLQCLAQQSSQTQIPPQVTFVAKDATALRAILQIAQQTRQPLGIILGESRQKLCEIHHAFQIHGEQIGDALDEAILDTGYSIRDEDDVLILLPARPDFLAADSARLPL